MKRFKSLLPAVLMMGILQAHASEPGDPPIATSLEGCAGATVVEVDGIHQYPFDRIVGLELVDPEQAVEVDIEACYHICDAVGCQIFAFYFKTNHCIIAQRWREAEGGPPILTPQSVLESQELGLYVANPQAKFLPTCPGAEYGRYLRDHAQEIFFPGSTQKKTSALPWTSSDRALTSTPQNEKPESPTSRADTTTTVENVASSSVSTAGRAVSTAGAPGAISSAATTQKKEEENISSKLPVASSTQAQPVASSTQAQPVASSTQAQPVASSTQTQPVASSAQAQPVASSTQAQPVASSTQAQPVASSTQAQPVASSTQAQPVASSTKIDGPNRPDLPSKETPVPTVSTTSRSATDSRTSKACSFIIGNETEPIELEEDQTFPGKDENSESGWSSWWSQLFTIIGVLTEETEEMNSTKGRKAFALSDAKSLRDGCGLSIQLVNGSTLVRPETGGNASETIPEVSWVNCTCGPIITDPTQSVSAATRHAEGEGNSEDRSTAGHETSKRMEQETSSKASSTEKTSSTTTQTTSAASSSTTTATRTVAGIVSVGAYSREIPSSGKIKGDTVAQQRFRDPMYEEVIVKINPKCRIRFEMNDANVEIDDSTIITYSNDDPKEIKTEKIQVAPRFSGFEIPIGECY